MRIALITDSYSPLRNSAAVMLEDLAIEFKRKGHTPIVITPDANLDTSITNTIEQGIQVLRIKTPRTKDIGYIRRTLSEFFLPYIMLYTLRRSRLFDLELDGLVWYSPSIFHGPLVKSLKKASSCKGYLILRDIFPDWAVDMGIMSRGLPYRFFKLVEAYQYKVADTIGVQSPSNLKYLKRWESPNHRQIEVLNNWLSDIDVNGCSISINKTSLAGRKIFVFAGNMGVAQGVDTFLDVVKRIDDTRNDIGFMFVGRGSELIKLRHNATKRNLHNILFYDEIPYNEIPGLYAQCHFGLVFLDSRHQTHNIPGKFISYMQNGLPVLACINKGNDLFDIIDSKQVGRAYEGICFEKVVYGIHEMVDGLNDDTEVMRNCKALASDLFSTNAAVKKIVGSFSQ